MNPEHAGSQVTSSPTASTGWNWGKADLDTISVAMSGLIKSRMTDDSGRMCFSDILQQVKNPIDIHSAIAGDPEPPKKKPWAPPPGAWR